MYTTQRTVCSKWSVWSHVEITAWTDIRLHSLIYYAHPPLLLNENRQK